MKITFVVAGGLGLEGGQRAIATYADRLIAKGHDVALVVQPLRVPGLRQRLRATIRARHGQSLPSPPRSPSPSHFSMLGVPVTVLERHRPVVDADVPDADVVVATWWETADWVWRLSASKGAKVHFLQDYEIWGGGVERVDATCRLPIPKIVASRWIRDLLEERFQQVALACIPYGVDTTRFYAAHRAKQSVPTVGLTYTTFKNKGCDLSLRAFDLARQVVPELRLVAYGNMPVSPNLPLPPGATYLCKVADDELRQTYARCDAWLFGTRVEGFGLPILEAMACRTPVIATPAGAAPDILEHGAGVLIEPEDPQAMAQAIVTLCHMPEKQWHALSAAAYRRAMEYSWDEATCRFEAALQQARVVSPSHVRA